MLATDRDRRCRTPQSWLLVSRRLPHRDAPWTALLPGALLFGVGIEVIHVIAAYFIAPYASRSREPTAHSASLRRFSSALFLISRLIVGAAIVNATLWERHARTTE